MPETCPTATIVVPAYNATATLPATMASLLAQTFGDFEIVLVEDGATDATPAMCADYAAADRRVRVVRQANRGLAGARNTGIAAARGRYVGFCDADDLWLPGKLAAHVAHLDAIPDLGISYSGSAMIDAAGRRTGHRMTPKLTGVTASDVFRRNPIGNGSAAVVRAGALRALAFMPTGETVRPWVFDETFRQSEDIECWLRLVLTTAWRIEGIPGHLTLYRVHGAGLSADTGAQYASWERMVDKLGPCAPAFFAAEAPVARAFQCRYLARRAVSAGDGTAALGWLRRAFAASSVPLWRDPGRTLVTLGATACLLAFGPAALRRAEAALLSART
ncbi:glycosyltransferase family 2 protein [Roseivivax isoporae]|uniref:Glucosyl transferase n=1 Tax=Roseivivax isoporae LMG 25204 TaxID=1449351 RepID=X7F5Z5_9RHOB|nr:glycosyltransferase family 2 protein [Roseivivax isoporae]ETX28225.1 glucosyl transferase [Roseivivax isoporae LMG 25204]